jgi:hypothetical protein
MIDNSKLIKVCQYEDKVSQACMVYFKKFPENKAWFTEQLEEQFHRFKYYGEYRNHISLTAAPLAEKIYKELNIVTFPFIIRTASRGWGTSSGTWAWAMKSVYQGVYTGDIGSCDPVKYLLKKNVKLYAAEYSFGEIGGQELKAKEGH